MKTVVPTEWILANWFVVYQQQKFVRIKNAVQLIQQNLAKFC